MLHYYGDKLAMELGEAAKEYIEHEIGVTWLPKENDGSEIKVPFFDLTQNKKRYVKFVWLIDQWVFVDLVD